LLLLIFILTVLTYLIAGSRANTDSFLAAILKTPFPRPHPLM